MKQQGMAPLGGVHPQPARPGAPARRQPARADAEMAIMNARDVYTRRNEGVSIWVVRPPTSPRARPARRDRCSIPPTARSIATRPSTRSPTSWGTCDGREGPALFEYLLRLGDNCLILGHRLSEWCGHAPALEEDLALANVALDLIGQAQLWLTLPARSKARGGTPTSSPTCATRASSATCSWSSSRTATSP